MKGYGLIFGAEASTFGRRGRAIKLRCDDVHQREQRRGSSVLKRLPATTVAFGLAAQPSPAGMAAKSTACTVLLAGKQTTPSSFLTRSSRIFLAP